MPDQRVAVSDSAEGQSGHLRHPPALLGTLAAGLGAALTVIHFMPGALFRARLANIGAKTAKGLSELTAPGHITGRQAANLPAIHVQFYTARHAFNVLLSQTRNSTVVAFRGAGITGIDA